MLTTLVLQQDYVWFMVVLTWSGTAVWWWLHQRRHPSWHWLPWTAAAGAVVASVELAAMSLPMQPAPYVPPYPQWDRLEGAVIAIMVAGWIFAAWRGKKLNGWLAWPAIGCVLLSGLARIDAPREGTWMLASCFVMAGAIHFKYARGAARLLIAFMVLAWLGSGWGPLAEEGILVPRRWTELNAGSLLASVAHLVLALSALISLRQQTESEPDSVRSRESRLLIMACVLWLTLGLWLAWGLSGWARQNFEASAVGRAAAAVPVFETLPLVELLNEDFELQLIKESTQHIGNPTLHGVVPRMETPAGWALAKTLSRIEQANTDVSFVVFGTLRKNWLLLIGSSQQSGPASSVGLFRENDPTDLADWAAPQARYLRPHATQSGLQTYARAAVTGPDGRMLGWVVLLFSLQTWIASQAQARLLVFVIIALGLGLTALVALQRRRWRERESARALAQTAQEADLMKTAFLAKVSHELRTPIQSILGYSELLRAALPDPVSRGRLNALRQHTDLMLRLVNDLLDLSAIQMGAFRLRERPAPLCELVRQTVESLRPRAEAKALTYSVHFDAHTPEWALVDSERVRQIVLNLISNAVKFTDRGNVLVTFGPGLQETDVQLVVSDSGPGIPPADQGRLFQPFTRLETTASKEGTGLGLSLAAALCRSMRGKITVESGFGKGATFTATFAALRCEPPVTAQGATHESAARLRGLRILIADDNTLVRELFAASLTEAGAECVTVIDGEAALTALSREKFDALVLDLAMPRVDGWETARRVRLSAEPALRIIGVSAHANAMDQERAATAGFDAFLSKPVELTALTAAVSPSLTTPTAAAKLTELTVRLRAQFRSEATAQRGAIVAALQENDATGVHAAAHYLRNSAIVIGDDLLRDAASLLENAAQTGDKSSRQTAWQACEDALAPWLPAAPLPVKSTSAANSQNETSNPS